MVKRAALAAGVVVVDGCAAREAVDELEDEWTPAPPVAGAGCTVGGAVVSCEVVVGTWPERALFALEV
jgi:hypothetical protein